MRRPLLDALLEELGRVSGKRHVNLIGSQCIHAATADVPAEVLMSREVDVLLPEDDPALEIIRSRLGPGSDYEQEHLVYVDVVTAGFPTLPPGWEPRTRLLRAGLLDARCLEIHDLAISKLAAGRLKDYELVAVLVSRHLVDLATARARIDTVADLHLRVILLARLQIVVESAGR